MYHLLLRSITLHFAYSVCLCVSYCTLTAINYLNKINKLIFVIAKYCVIFDVWTDLLYIFRPGACTIIELHCVI
jgi:hypothetical protein